MTTLTFKEWETTHGNAELVLTCEEIERLFEDDPRLTPIRSDHSNRYGGTNSKVVCYLMIRHKVKHLRGETVSLGYDISFYDAVRERRVKVMRLIWQAYENVAGVQPARSFEHHLYPKNSKSTAVCHYLWWSNSEIGMGFIRDELIPEVYKALKAAIDRGDI